MATDRGATVFFEDITFTDIDGVTVTVDSATLNLSYPLGDSFEEEEITLTDDAGVWSGSWDSGVADPGYVHGHLEGVDGTDVFAKDFKFKLTANRANERDT